MFNMKIEKQLNMDDRTLLAGKPTFSGIPPRVMINDKKYKVIGRSQGIKLPFVSLEIEKTDDKLEGYEAKGVEIL